MSVWAKDLVHAFEVIGVAVGRESAVKGAFVDDVKVVLWDGKGEEIAETDAFTGGLADYLFCTGNGGWAQFDGMHVVSGCHKCVQFVAAATARDQDALSVARIGL